MARFHNLGVIENDAAFNNQALETFIRFIEERKTAGSWTKAEIVALFYKMIPDFGYKETGKYLDGKM